ncbi:hypothetical protein KM043_009589 [Ampulex compressa]|nr:hypothetical protein KM043_009589 [Ampulex compressa]
MKRALLRGAATPKDMAAILLVSWPRCITVVSAATLATASCSTPRSTNTDPRTSASLSILTMRTRDVLLFLSLVGHGG